MDIRLVSYRFLCFSSVFCAAFLRGYGTSWFIPSIHWLNRSKPLVNPTEVNLNIFEGISNFGQILCCACFVLFIQQTSRKKFISTSITLQVCVWCLLGISDFMNELLFCQFILGVSIAYYDVIYCVYLSEISTPRARAILISISLFICLFGAHTPFFDIFLEQYQYLFAFSSLIFISGLIGIYCLPESPYYLLMIGREEKAMLNLTILNPTASANQILEIYRQLQQYQDMEVVMISNNNVMQYHAKGDYKALLFVVLMNAAGYTSGFWIYFNFEPVVLQTLAPGFDLNFVINVFSWTAIVAVFISVFTVEYLTRQLLMVIGFSLSCILQLTLAIFLYSKGTIYEPTNVNKIIFATATLTLFVCMTTVYPIVNILRGEMLTHSLTITGNALAVIFSLLTASICNAIFNPITEFAGAGFNLCFYASVSWIATIYALLYYRETSKLSLLEIRSLYRI